MHHKEKAEEKKKERELILMSWTTCLGIVFLCVEQEKRLNRINS